MPREVVSPVGSCSATLGACSPAVIVRWEGKTKGEARGSSPAAWDALQFPDFLGEDREVCFLLQVAQTVRDGRDMASNHAGRNPRSKPWTVL